MKFENNPSKLAEYFNVFETVREYVHGNERASRIFRDAIAANMCAQRSLWAGDEAEGLNHLGHYEDEMRRLKKLLTMRLGVNDGMCHRILVEMAAEAVGL